MKTIQSLLLIAALLGLPAHIQAQTSGVPGSISYQGRVLNASGVPIGNNNSPVTRTVIFRIWDHPSNAALANLLYSEQQTVTISEGEFSVLVGEGSATITSQFGFSETSKGKPSVTIDQVFNGTSRYLGVTVDDGTAAADNEVSPRQQIVSSAFAFRAKSAETLGSSVGTALTALDSGNVGIGNTNPPALLTVSGANTSLSTSTPQFVLTADDTTERMRFGVDSTGTGTGFIQAFKEGTGAQNLLLNPNGGNVGIGVTNPTSALHVEGVAQVSGLVMPGGSADVSNVGTPGNFIAFGHVPFSNDNLSYANNTFFFRDSPLFTGFDFSDPNIDIGSGTYIGGSASLSSINVAGTVTAGSISVPSFSPDTVSVSGIGGYKFKAPGDTDGGMFSSSDGNVSLRTDGVNRLAIDPAGTVAIPGMVMQGSGTGTANPPGKPLLLRRIVSTNTAIGSVVAISESMSLQRDGTTAGLRIVVAPNSNNQDIVAMGLSSSNATVNRQLTFTNVAFARTFDLFSNGENIVFAHISFGNPFNAEGQTVVTLQRRNGDTFYTGTVISTVNQ